jgi:hypothetical protein
MSALLDITALSGMTQLRALHLRPACDTIERTQGKRVKEGTGALYWSAGVCPRVWDRWLYAFSPGIPCVHNKLALHALPSLQSIVFPITIRASEQEDIRARAVLPLKQLRQLVLGRAVITDHELGLLTTTITYLSLGYCKGITEAGMRAIGRMRHLKTLMLHGCAFMTITDDWESLMSLSQLQTLAMFGRLEGENVHFYKLQDPSNGSVPMSAVGMPLLDHFVQTACPCST